MKKIIFLAVLLLMSPTFVFGATAEELQAQINALLAQVQQLQQQLNQQQNTTTQWCYTFNNNLQFGDRNKDVINLKEAFKREGLYNGPVNDYFGNLTKAAVIKFQEKYANEILTPTGLQYGTGFVGEYTRKKLNELYGCGDTASIPPTIGQLTYKISSNPTSLIRGQNANFRIGILGGQPNSPILFYLQRPDGTMKYDGYNTGKYTYIDGSYENDAEQFIAVDGKNGTWVSWVSVKNIISNKQEHNVIGSTPPPSTPTSTPSIPPSTPTSTPSIMVFSPNGGEVWEIGKTYNITWSGKNFPSNGVVGIVLVDEKTATNTNIFTEISNDGIESWTIPSTITPSGNYMRIFCGIKGSEAYCGDKTQSEDFSDAPFTIVKATPAKNVYLSKISPSSGSIGTIVTLYGEGFSQSNNAIMYGPAKSDLLGYVNSTDNGTKIILTVPQYTHNKAKVTPGAYNVSVISAYGLQSNTLPFAVTEGVAFCPGAANFSIGASKSSVSTGGYWDIWWDASNFERLLINTYFNGAQKNVYDTSSGISKAGNFSQIGGFTTAGVWKAVATAKKTGCGDVIKEIEVKVGQSTASTLKLIRIEVASSAISTEITLHGEGFSADGNRVKYGPGYNDYLGGTYSSTDNGTKIKLIIPQPIWDKLAKGKVFIHGFWVVNADGVESNSISFKVL